MLIRTRISDHLIDLLDAQHVPHADVTLVGTPPTGAVVVYRPEATAQDQANGAAIVAAFNFSAAAHQAWLDSRQANLVSMQNAAVQAISDNNAFIANATPTNAQVVAQVKRLSQECNAIIRHLVEV